MILNFDTNKDITQYMIELLEDKAMGITLNDAEKFISLADNVTSGSDLLSYCSQWGTHDPDSVIPKFDYIDGSSIQFNNQEIPHTC